MYVVTPRCAAAAAAAVVSAVVLRRPTKEYTHPYCMMHRRLPTAGIEVRPQYHQLLVMRQGRGSEATEAVFSLQSKKPLHNGSHERRVPKIKNQTLFCTRDV